VNTGASIETIAKAMSGKVVRNPKRRLLKPVLSSISLTKGPILANVGRKLTAMSKIPTSNNVFFFFWGVSILTKAIFLAKLQNQ
jgi:hypothetical protein